MLLQFKWISRRFLCGKDNKQNKQIAKNGKIFIRFHKKIRIIAKTSAKSVSTKVSAKQ